jgi:hypothetical protein
MSLLLLFRNSASTGNTGSLSSTLAPVSLGSDADLKLAASLSKELGALTLSSAGSSGSIITGALNSTLSAATLLSSSALRIVGTLAGTLDPATLAASARLKITGAESSPLDSVTLASASALRVTGALGVTLETVTLTANGALRVTGSLAVTLDPAALSATGTSSPETRLGWVYETLGDLTLSSAAKANIGGASAGALANLTLSSVGKLRVLGQASNALGSVTLSSAGKLLSTGPRTLTDQDRADIKALVCACLSDPALWKAIASLVPQGLTSPQATQLIELWRLSGLDSTRPLIVGNTQRTAGSEIEQTISESGGTVTVTRET